MQEYPITDPNRRNDPKTAPMVPVYTHISANRDIEDEVDEISGVVLAKDKGWKTEIVITAWHREQDTIIEYKFEGPLVGELRKKPLSLDDIEWLRNIGARP
jgi:hypothetical protein